MIEILTVKHDLEKEQLVKLFRLSFGREMSEKLWEWKYITNPYVSPSSEVIVAVDGGRIIGARPFLPTELWLDNQKILAAQHCDTMVHPDFRNQGLFGRMGKQSIKYLRENNYALSYGFPGPMSRPGFLKQGYRVVVPTEMMFRPINYQRIFTKRLHRNILGKSLGYIFDTVSNKRTLTAASKNTDIVVEIFDSYIPALREIDFWKRTTKIDFVRSEKNLRWRFDQHPVHAYKYITAKRKSILCGYAVISVQAQESGLVYGMIIDYSVKGDDLECFDGLVEQAVRELYKTDCDLMVTWAFSKPKFREELRKRFGFKSTVRFPYNKIIDSGYFEALSLNDKVFKGVDIYNKDSWRITYIYPDYA